MKILEEGQIPEDPSAGMQHVGKTFRCPTCSTVFQLEAKDIAHTKKIFPDAFERLIACPICGNEVTFTTDELIHENVTPPSWEEIRSQMHKEYVQNGIMRVEPKSDLSKQYKLAVLNNDEEAQERILRQVWEEKNTVNPVSDSPD